MFADPRPTPVTCGCVVGVVAPAATSTVDVTVTLDGSLLVKVTVTPPAGAGVVRVTASGPDCPTPTVTPAANVMEPGLATVTFAVVSAMPGALARITVEPGATPVTGTVAVVAPAAKVAVGGTVATTVLSEIRLTVRPPDGAGADRVRVRFCVPVPVMVRLAGVKLIVGAAPTFTVAVADVKPEDVAVIVLLPAVPGVTVTLAPVAPAAMVTLFCTVATPVLLLFRFTTWPPAPAGIDRVTVRVPGAVVRFSGFGVRAMVFAPAVIVTVTGGLLVNPSFTISCTT